MTATLSDPTVCTPLSDNQAAPLMKLTLTFHTDDEAEDAVYDAVTAEYGRHQFEMTDREYENFIDKKVDEVYEALGKFSEDDCCLKVEFDLVAGTAVVKDRTH